MISIIMLRAQLGLIAYEAVYQALAGQADHTDQSLVQDMLKHWGAESIDDFYALAKKGFNHDGRARNKQFAQFAPTVTDAALQGSSIAKRVCNNAIEELQTGIQLLGTAFTSDVVQLACIGGVINSEYFSLQLRQSLASPGLNKKYEVVAPKLEPVKGSLLYALHRINHEQLDEVVSNLVVKPLLS